MSFMKGLGPQSHCDVTGSPGGKKRELGTEVTRGRRAPGRVFVVVVMVVVVQLDFFFNGVLLDTGHCVHLGCPTY